MPMPAKETEGNGVVGCVLTKLARNYFQPGTSVATGKIGFYAFIARTVCTGKISLEFAQEFSSTRPSVANSSRGNKWKESLLDYPNKESYVSRFT